MTDRELLEAAAKAADVRWQNWTTTMYAGETELRDWPYDWNPLTDDGDALRLAVKLRLSIIHENEYVQGQNIPTIEVIGQEREDGSRDCEMHSLDDDPCAAVRRAVVRAAAALAAREAP